MRTLFHSLLVALSTCSGVLAQTTEVIYVNGIQNTWADARDSARAIQETLNGSIIRTEDERRSFTVRFVWNPSGWSGVPSGCTLCQDKRELFLLKTAEEHFAADFQRISLPHHMNRVVPREAALRVRAYLDDMTPGGNLLEAGGHINDAHMVATRNAIQGIVTEVRRRRAAVVVAHSQGNLLANLAWASLAAEEDSAVARQMRVVNIANTSQFSVNGLNLTHARDAALFSAATDRFDIDVSLETMPSQGANWTRSTPACQNAACNFTLAEPSFGGVDATGGLLDHAVVDTYLSSRPLPVLLASDGVAYSTTAIRFKDRFEDLMYAAAASLEASATIVQVVQSGDIHEPRAVISPNGGERWRNGETRTVTWAADAFPGEQVDLYVLHDSPEGLLDSPPSELVKRINRKQWYRFGNAVSNSGRLVLDPVVMGGTGNQYLVLVVSVSDRRRFDLSNATFSLNL